MEELKGRLDELTTQSAQSFLALLKELVRDPHIRVVLKSLECLSAMIDQTPNFIESKLEFIMHNVIEFSVSLKKVIIEKSNSLL